MRLIDADKIIDKLKEYTRTNNGEFNGACRSIIEVIEQQPTAYDVDKVVEQLKALDNAEVDYYSSNDVIDREDAIDIVEKGGLDE